MQFVSAKNGRLVLGEQEIRLKGFNYSDPDSPWAWCKKWNPEAARRGMAAARALESNCLRIWTPSSLHEVVADQDAYELMSWLLDTAEQNGIRLYIGLRWKHSYADAGTLEDKENIDYLRGLIDLFRDEPRVVAYDLTNEGDHLSHKDWQWAMNPREAERRLIWLRRMRDVIKELDSNHLISMGAVFSYSHWTPTLPFTMESFVDFVDFHYYRRNYRESTLAQAIRETREHTDKPIVIGEFGFPSCPKFSTLGEPVHSEELQVEMFDEMLEDCEAENASGALAWSLTEYSMETELGESTYGILRSDYTPKPVAEVFKRRFVVL